MKITNEALNAAMSVMWTGVCSGKYTTDVMVIDGQVHIEQADDSFGTELVVLNANEAIDISFAILRDLAPTLHETLMQLNVDK